MRDTITGRKSFNFGNMFTNSSEVTPALDTVVEEYSMSVFDDNYCNSVTLEGKMCGNHVHENRECFIHRTSRCNSITKRGKRCKNHSFYKHKCHSHQPFQELDNLLIDHQKELDKMAKIVERANQMAKKSRRVTFDLSENVTHEVSRYIEDFEKHPNGKYVYEIDTQRLF